MSEIEIKVVDKVATTISTSLKNIAQSARDADKAINSLNTTSNKIVGSLQKIELASQKLATEQQRTSIAMARAATEAAKAAKAQQLLEQSTNRTMVTEARAAVALEKLTQAEARTAIAIEKLTVAQNQASVSAQKLLNVQNTAAVSAQKLATEQQRTQAAANNTATAQQRLATETVRTATAQNQSAVAAQKLATEQQRTNVATAQAAVSTQRLATEQARTSREVANTAAAESRAALAASRLAKSQEQAASSSQSLSTTMRALGAVAVTAFSAKKILDAADAYTTLQNKLANVTDSQAQVNKLTEELFALANRTRTGVDETATAFTRFDRALKLMGKSQEDSLRLTETVNKALIVSGATTSEAASSLLQLSQAFNSGRLQGDEFRSVAENMPVVLDAVAQAMGVAVNEVKKLSTEGKITSEVLFKAFQLIQKQVDDTFAKTLPTVGQTFQVISNSVQQVFGEFNKATGFTRTLTDGFLSIAAHAKEATVAIITLGTAIMLAFGAEALAAVKAFTVAISRNPVILIATALAGVIATIIVYREEIVNATEVTQKWSDENGAFFTEQRTGWAGWLLVITKAIDTAISYFKGFVNILGKIFGTPIKVIGDAFTTVWNAIVETAQKAFDKLVEMAGPAINSIISVINKLRSSLGQSLLEMVDLTAMKKDINETFEKVGKDWADSLQQGFNSQDQSITKTVESWLNEIQKISSEGKGVELRPSGQNQLASAFDSKSAKQIENRALALARVNLQLDNELKRMSMLQRERENQAKFDTIEESLFKKRITLHTDEEIAIKRKIEAIKEAGEVQQELDNIYQESIGPTEVYETQVKAINLALEKNIININEYTVRLKEAEDTYKKVAAPLQHYVSGMREELRLLSMMPHEREIENEALRLELELRKQGKYVSTEESLALRQEIRDKNIFARVIEEENRLLDDSVYKREELGRTLTALQNLTDKYPDFKNDDQMLALEKTAVGEYISQTEEMNQARIDSYARYYNVIKDMRTKNFVDEQNQLVAQHAVFSKQLDVRLDQASVFFDALSGLSKSGNEKVAKIGKGAAIISATIDTYRAANAAVASLAGIPYVGPVLAAGAAAGIIAAGLANVAMIKSQPTGGFAQGGYTGNRAKDEIAGYVHGREFVMNANATSRIGVGNLQALQSGAANVNRNTPVKQAPTTQSKQSGTVVNMRNINVLDPALVGDYLGTPQGEQVLINTMRRNSDQMRSIIGAA